MKTLFTGIAIGILVIGGLIGNFGILLVLLKTLGCCVAWFKLAKISIIAGIALSAVSVVALKAIL